MRFDIIYIIWSSRDGLLYRNFVMLGRSNRILIACYSSENTLSCTVEAREIKNSKDFNKDRRHMADI